MIWKLNDIRMGVPYGYWLVYDAVVVSALLVRRRPGWPLRSVCEGKRLTPQERVTAAIELAQQVYKRLRDWEEEPDPVAQRRHQVRAAALLRDAADLLDDSGRLSA